MGTGIRRAQHKDIEWVQECANRAYTIYEARIGKKPAPMFADYHAQVGAGILHILRTDGEDCGFIVVYPQDDHLFIENIAVHPVHQGKGHGKTLLHFAEKLAQKNELNAIELYTNEHMSDNLSLYSRLGYEETERREEDGYNRIYFRKRRMS
ncbi:GNAT family N-acetyltransferase [Rhodobacteraceae bacterium RKSG542]|uniref:GNAT family N-acetyltransferase n=1 Tax=Pseudovibrio flavus TaxID=2529854 RepID=UPI0012BBDB16|nr:GNAT family N-acetyltransferase [Pseudovibrio flavus]MTI18692.1 GNAT family N-acetyltransferase [Pseudovibrio flavus]